jgi:hypothetical protein
VRNRVYLTEEEARHDRLRRNEKIKASATIASQFGAALIAAAAVRIYDELSLDKAAAFWILVGSVLICFTMWSLGKLEAE